ncbi:MAG: glycosyltransferase family 4 protein [Armatimonadetes bacterium]|nr:glycosyltransferase family 4 protein [Armatimonadota bacterium]
MGGAEKVVEALHDLYPEAPVYTSVYDPAAMPREYRSWDIRTSSLQRWPARRRLHRLMLPFYPAAFESFDLSAYDVVVSSSSAFAKGVITLPHTRHICYMHAPMRYVWMTDTYLKGERAGRVRGVLGPVFHYLRMWDQVSASRVDTYVANSTAVQQRIAKFYRRDAIVVPPPVDTGRFVLSEARGDHYIAVSRFVPYKRMDMAVEAMTRLGRPLKVVGTGRQEAELKKRAGPTVEFLGWVDNDRLPALVANARAFLMPGEEDFGSAPVEANAAGRPVIAYAAGGALDTQTDGATGVLYAPQTVEALCAAVDRFERMDFDHAAIAANAQGFDTAQFKLRMRTVIED